NGRGRRRKRWRPAIGQVFRIMRGRRANVSRLRSTRTTRVGEVEYANPAIPVRSCRAKSRHPAPIFAEELMLSPQWLDELRARVTLSAIIMRTTKLTRAGREWKACCPFHNEKTPSFTVSDEKGFYHCFGCGAHGDAIRWMTDQRGLSFMDAVKDLDRK